MGFPIDSILEFIFPVITTNKHIARIKFQDEESEKEAFVTLSLEGHSFSVSQDYIYRLTSQEQLRFLDERNLNYDIL